MSQRMLLPGPFAARLVVWVVLLIVFPLTPAMAAMSFRVEVLGPDNSRVRIVLALPPSGVQGASSSDNSMPAKPRLRKVIHRNPVPFMPHAHVPDYLLCYVIETLECGHTQTVFPQTGDPLIAKNRRCGHCDDDLKVLPIRVLKKLPQSVESDSGERKRA